MKKHRTESAQTNPGRKIGLVLAGLALPGILMIMAALLVPAPEMQAHSLHGSRNTTPPEDFILTLYAIGAWNGNFDVDAQGRGGLAALHTMVERKRREAAAGNRGGVLLVQSGNFTGSAGPGALQKKIEHASLNLPHYLRLDALGPAAAETLAYAGLKASRQAGFMNTPAVSFNLRASAGGASANSAGRVEPFRLVRRDNYTAMITSVTSGAEPNFSVEPIELLAREFRRQSGVDLYVLMLDRKANEAAAPVIDSHNLHDAPAPKTQAAYLNAIELLERREFWESFFPIAPGATPDPYALPDHPFALQWLIVESSAKRNHFRRLHEGPYLCSIADNAVCEITVEFRRRRVRGVRARFIDLNGPQSPGGWITPDPILLETLKKPK
ncbi:MAG: hypothetical protein NXI24_12230 [bacterium]|nr:hypothetical protein [bacterium]